MGLELESKQWQEEQGGQKLEGPGSWRDQVWGWAIMGRTNSRKAEGAGTEEEARQWGGGRHMEGHRQEE